MKFHPFNLQQRIVAYRYRKKDFESVIEITDRYLSKNTNDIYMLEMRARASISLRKWEQAMKWYHKVFQLNPSYLDCSFQLARCAIYTKNWKMLDLVASNNIHDLKIIEIQNAFIKKIDSLESREFIAMAQYPHIVESLPQRCLERWTNLSFELRPKEILGIDRFCLDSRIGGDYLGYMLYTTILRSEGEARNTLEYFSAIHKTSQIAKWISPALEEYPIEMECVLGWFLGMINPHKMDIVTLESICVNEKLSPALELIVKEYLKYCSPDELGDAIRAIGRKSDPRTYIAEETLVQMINNGIQLFNHGTGFHTWMLEHILRIENTDLLNSIFMSEQKGILHPTLKVMSNLLSNRSDKRLIDILKEVVNSKYLLTSIEMRHSISRALLKIAEPEIAHSFAMESILLEPQDAFSGYMALQAAISSGSSQLILETADIVLSMKSRSSNIDYASIAIAAIRMNNVSYAEELLKENRLKTDLQGHRVRIGIQFFEIQDFNGAIKEIENTPAKFRSDHTILLYHALSLANIGEIEQAVQLVHEKISHLCEKNIALHIIYSLGNNHFAAKKALEDMMVMLKMEKLPRKWIQNGLEFEFLYSEPPNTTLKSINEKLVTVIMTTHKWNDYFPVAVNSILNQTYQNIEFIVVDDFSDPQDLGKYDSILNDPRITRVRMNSNVGTYACRNKGIDLSSGEFITFADSDDWNHPQKIEMSVKQMENENLDILMGRFIRLSESGKIWFNGNKLSQFSLVGMVIRTATLHQFNLRFDGRARFGADSEFLERAEILLESNKIKRTNNIELIALHHSESLTGGGPNRIDWTGPGEVRKRYAEGFRRNLELMKSGTLLTEEEGFSSPTNEILVPIPTFSQKRIRDIFDVSIADYHSSSTNTKAVLENEKVYAFMATYPGGFEKVGKAINSLLNQSKPFDQIILHVNGEKRPPNLPKSSRLKVICSKKDFADNGKFRHMNGLSGYFFTVDDDIDYPNDYVEKMIEHIERFDRTTLIGVHAALIPYGPPISRWSHYRELRRSHVFTQQQASFNFVNVIGTGTMAFHSDLGTPAWKTMNTKRMVDLHIAVWAQKNKIPMRTCIRKKNWLTEFVAAGEQRIWQQANIDKELQNQMIQTLGNIDFWSSEQVRKCILKKGPLHAHENWFSREIPPLMKLKETKGWPKMSDNPKVTIYIPAYNVATYIEECVDSALSQTYSNFEVSIHNDGSSDDTYKILTSKYGGNPKVILSTDLNQGIGKATNQAISNGNGELILQLDSDDIIEPNTLELLVKAIGNEYVCAYGNFRRVNPDGSIIDQGWEAPTYSHERLMRDMIVHPPRLFRRDAWELVGRHDTELINAEDFDFFLRMSEVGSMIHVREILYSYRILETSSSRAQSEIMTKNTSIVINNALIRRNIKNFEITIPNPEFPRRYIFKHTSFIL